MSQKSVDMFIINLAANIYARMHGKLPITDKNFAHNNSQMEQAIDYAEMFYQKLKARNYVIEGNTDE